MTPIGELEVDRFWGWRTPIGELRENALPLNVPPAAWADPYDDHSQHIVVKSAGRIIAGIRRTAAPPYPLDAGLPFAIYREPGTHELSRIAVVPEFRGIGLMRLVIVRACIDALAAGGRVIVGAAEQDVPWRKTFDNLGFEEASAPTVIDSPPRGQVRVVVLRLNLESALTQPSITWAEVCSEFERKGFQILPAD